MKAELYTNCSLVRLPIQTGVEEYYLPQNVEWADKVIDKIVICAPQTACVDPIDGQTAVLDASTIADCYVNLYDANNNELMHDVSFENILHLNNNVLDVNAKLNLSLCRIYFTSAPAADATMLLYVFYETRKEDNCDLPFKSVTAIFDLDADEEITLQEVINTYVHALPNRIKGIICWSAVSYPAWITLRDYALTYQMVNIHTEMCRPDLNGGNDDAKDTQAALFLLNDLDVNFDYSHIREAAGQASTQKITFLY